MNLKGKERLSVARDVNLHKDIRIRVVPSKYIKEKVLEFESLIDTISFVNNKLSKQIIELHKQIFGDWNK